MADSAPDREKFPQRKSLPHEAPPWVRSGSTFFLTLCCTPRGRDQLCHAEIAAAVFASVEHRQQKNDWFVHLLVLMPDHLHALMAFPIAQSVARTVRLWKTFLARQHGIDWQRDFFEHRIRNDEEFQSKAAYIRANPVRGGLVCEGDAWPFVWEPR